MSTIDETADSGKFPTTSEGARHVRRALRAVARIGRELLRHAPGDDTLRSMLEQINAAARIGEDAPPVVEPLSPVALPSALAAVDEPLREAEEGASTTPASATPGALLVMVRAARVRLRALARTMPTDAPPPSGKPRK